MQQLLFAWHYTSDSPRDERVEDYMRYSPILHAVDLCRGSQLNREMGAASRCRAMSVRKTT